MFYAEGYRPYLPDQDLLLPPSLREWVAEEHLVYFVSDVVDQLDLSAIHAVYGEEKRGQPPYDPRYGQPFGAPALAESRAEGFGGSGSQLQRRAPVRASKARTTPAGMSARVLSSMAEPTTTISSITAGGEVM